MILIEIPVFFPALHCRVPRFCHKRFGAILILLAFCASSSFLYAADALDQQYKIRAMGPGDLNFVQSQQALGESLIYQATYTRLNGELEHDLRLLQKTIDSKTVGAAQRRELQALGSLLGRMLAREFRLEWVVYVDVYGRSRGLQIDDTRQVVFPTTMISRRVEADATVNVAAIYKKAVEIIRYTRANKPLYAQ